MPGSLRLPLTRSAGVSGPTRCLGRRARALELARAQVGLGERSQNPRLVLPQRLLALLERASRLEKGRCLRRIYKGTLLNRDESTVTRPQVDGSLGILDLVDL